MENALIPSEQLVYNYMAECCSSNGRGWLPSKSSIISMEANGEEINLFVRSEDGCCWYLTIGLLVNAYIFVSKWVIGTRIGRIATTWVRFLAYLMEQLLRNKETPWQLFLSLE